MLHLAWMLSTVVAYDTSAWKCFDEAPVVVKYQDTGNPVDLPHYRTLVGGWDSWQHMNWVARILLKEKMGVDLDYWCTESLAEHWSKCDLNYPVSTWDHVEVGNIDVNLEAWPRAAEGANHVQREMEGKVIDIGPVGYIGTARLFTADYDGTWTLGDYKGLLEESVKSQLYADMLPYFNKYKAEGWLYKFEPWEAPGAFYKNENPTIPTTATTNQTRPFIFSCHLVGVYGRLLWDKLNQLGIAAEYDLWVTSTEERLSMIADEMGAANKHFVAMFYLPGYDVISFPKQSVSFPVPTTDTCSVEGTCENSDKPVTKVANPKTINKIPEVGQFFRRLAVSMTQMSHMQYFRRALDLEHKDSACKWIKENESAWSGLITPIIRHEDLAKAWVIYVQIGALVFAVGFMIFITRQMWLCLSGEEESNEDTKSRHEKNARMELTVLIAKCFLEVIDVGTTTYALWTCFQVAGDNFALIAGFCACLIVEVVYSAFAVSQRIEVTKDLVDRLRGLGDKNARRGTVKLYKDAGKSKYKHELITFVVGFGEDLPSIILSIIVMRMGHRDGAFIYSFAWSCLCFGHKLTSLEKMNIWRKKNPLMFSCSKDTTCASQTKMQMWSEEAALDHGEIMFDESRKATIQLSQGDMEGTEGLADDVKKCQ